MADNKSATNSEELAALIRKLSEGFEQLKKTGLTRNAIVVLLKDSTWVSNKSINQVLDGLAGLAKQYTLHK